MPDASINSETADFQTAALEDASVLLPPPLLIIMPQMSMLELWLPGEFTANEQENTIAEDKGIQLLVNKDEQKERKII